MLVGKKVDSKTDYYEFIQRPENVSRTFELIDGELKEKMPSFAYSSGISARVMTFVGMYLLTNDIAHITDAQGGYEIGENTLVPDVGVILKVRQPELPRDRYIPIPPDLVIEVVSQSDYNDPKNRIEKKLRIYLEAQIPLIWYLFPERREVEVYARNSGKQVLGVENTLDGGDVLPGFKLAVRDIFPE